MTTPSLGQTEEDIKAYVLRKLGLGMTSVELTSDHMNDVINDTKRWFVNRAGFDSYMPLQVQKNVGEYSLPVHVIDVYDVVLPSTGLLNFSADDDFLRPYGYMYGSMINGYGSGVSRGQDQMPYSGLLQTLQMLEMTGRLMGLTNDYKYDAKRRVLMIMPPPFLSGTAILKVNSAMFNTIQLDPEDLDLFLRWAIAEAKDTLGRIRSKYDSVPTVGGDRTLNGDTLLLESQTEKEALERQVIDRNMDHGYIIITG